MTSQRQITNANQLTKSRLKELTMNMLEILEKSKLRDISITSAMANQLIDNFSVYNGLDSHHISTDGDDLFLLKDLSTEPKLCFILTMLVIDDEIYRIVRENEQLVCDAFTNCDGVKHALHEPKILQNQSAA